MSDNYINPNQESIQKLDQELNTKFGPGPRSPNKGIMSYGPLEKKISISHSDNFIDSNKELDQKLNTEPKYGPRSPNKGIMSYDP